MARRKQTTEEAQGASNDVAIVAQGATVAPIEGETIEVAIIDEEETAVALPKKINAPHKEVFEAYGLIKAGYSFGEIRQMHPQWKRHKFYAIKAAVQQLVKRNVMAQEEAMADVVTKYQDLYKIAYSNLNIKECRNILDSLAKVQGLTKEMNIEADFVAIWS